MPSAPNQSLQQTAAPFCSLRGLTVSFGRPLLNLVGDLRRARGVTVAAIRRADSLGSRWLEAKLARFCELEFSVLSGLERSAPAVRSFPSMDFRTEEPSAT